MAVFDDYTLASIRSELKDEFGGDDTGDVNAKIDQKINQAVDWIVRRRQNWPWLKKEHVIDVASSTNGTGDFTQGSRTVENVTGLPVKRDILLMGEVEGNGTTGYLITNVSGTTVTLDKQYRGTTEVGKIFTLQKYLFALPVDYIRLARISRLDSLLSDRMVYKRTSQFDHIRNSEGMVNIYDTVFTVRKDQLNETALRYLAIYPYVGRLTTFDITYWAKPLKLVEDDDIPVIPATDRMCLFYFAAWFYAQSIGDDRSLMYRDQALQALNDMLAEFEDVDTFEYDEPYDPTRFIEGPRGYPSFN